MRLDDNEELNLLWWILPVDGQIHLPMGICSMVSKSLDCPTHGCDLFLLGFYANILWQNYVFFGKYMLNYFATDCLLQHVSKGLVLVTAIRVEG